MDNITPEYFVNECIKEGVKVERLNLDSGLLTLRKDFKPGDLSEYTNAESSTSIIYSVPCVKSNSSTWGTTGDGVGGFVGCKNGVMRINRSSCKKAFLKEVKKILESKGITFQEGVIMDATIKQYYDTMIKAFKEFKGASIRKRSQLGLYSRYLLAKQNYNTMKGVLNA